MKFRTISRRINTALRHFLQLEISGSGYLLLAIVAGFVLANSPLAQAWGTLLHLQLFSVGKLPNTLHSLVNDGLMSLFFLLVGLELKREFTEGDLSGPGKPWLLATGAAIGGMVVPAVLYLLLVSGQPGLQRGWPIGTVTDIAFSLAAFAVLGRGLPSSLRVLLTSLAIVDDLGAIALLAIVFAHPISGLWAGVCVLLVMALWALNALKITNLWPYVLLGVGLWVALLYTGLHPTLAGVAVAFAIPGDRDAHSVQSPLDKLEMGFHPWVIYGVVPVFALVNAGIKLEIATVPALLLSPISVALMVAMCLGKPIGITLVSYALKWLKVCELPKGSSVLAMLATGCFAGIGFTVALFLAQSAFGASAVVLEQAKLALTIGAVVSCGLGWLLTKAYQWSKARPVA